MHEKALCKDTQIEISCKAFLLKDIDAVKNAIRYPYLNGLTEGINNKIKAIKRQMYGRATMFLQKISASRADGNNRILYKRL